MEHVFTNQHGIFRDGDPVWFGVENEISGGWRWDTHGTLCYRDGEWIIQVRQGVVTIDKGYDAYSNSIQRPVKSINAQIMDALAEQAKRMGLK